jgi:uncharacterized Zn finger protein (UPF0148 family)
MARIQYRESRSRITRPLKGGGKSGNSGKTLSNCLVHGDLRKTMGGLGMTMLSSEFQEFIHLAGGRIICPRCQARSKRTHAQCGAPAERGRRVCRFHGARSSGPKTEEGKIWAKQARTIHGNESRTAREELSRELVQIQELRVLAYLCGLVETMRGPGRPPGRKRTEEK